MRVTTSDAPRVRVALRHSRRRKGGQRFLQVQPCVRRIGEPPFAILLEAAAEHSANSAGACRPGASSSPAPCFSTDASRAAPSLPSNTGRPVSISRTTTPKAQRSLASVHRLAARPVQGVMSAAVPRIIPASRRRALRASGSSSPARSAPPQSVHRLRQAEVEHLHRAVRPDLDVRGLQVPVDDAVLVRCLECLGDLFRDRQRLFDRDRAARESLRRDRRLRRAPSPGR